MNRSEISKARRQESKFFAGLERRQSFYILKRSHYGRV